MPETRLADVNLLSIARFDVETEAARRIDSRGRR